MVLIKVITSYRNVVAICDKELLGKRFEEGKFQLDIKESFYKGEEVSEEEAIRIIKKMSREDATFNIVGKQSINTALKAGIIEKDGIGEIKGVPFALVLL
jgi:hypothetical protein